MPEAPEGWQPEHGWLEYESIYGSDKISMFVVFDSNFCASAVHLFMTTACHSHSYNQLTFGTGFIEDRSLAFCVPKESIEKPPQAIAELILEGIGKQMVTPLCTKDGLSLGSFIRNSRTLAAYRQAVRLENPRFRYYIESSPSQAPVARMCDVREAPIQRLSDD